GEDHHRGSALVDGLHAIGEREPLVQDLVRVVDLAATGAGEIAAKQRLQHQHQRVALAPHKMLAQHVSPDRDSLIERDTHLHFPCQAPLGSRAIDAARPGAASWGGSRNLIFSSIPGRVVTSTGPNRARASMTSSTSTSGAEAPAVRPTVVLPANHSRSSSLP